jgi:hypothetical protein
LKKKLEEIRIKKKTEEKLAVYAHFARGHCVEATHRTAAPPWRANTQRPATRLTKAPTLAPWTF